MSLEFMLVYKQLFTFLKRAYINLMVKLFIFTILNVKELRKTKEGD